ncbi:MAG: peptidylprolyl isomerase [Zavarzinella sp.]
MNRWTRMLFASIAATGLTATTYAQTPPMLPPPAGTPAAPTGPVAIVHGKEISAAAVERALRPVDPSKREMAKKEVVNFLVENALVDLYLEMLKVSVETKDVDTQLAAFKAEVTKAKQDYAKVLQDLAITEPELKTEIQNQLKWDKFVDTQATPETLKAFFSGNSEMFDGSEVKAKHILVGCKPEDATARTEAKTKITAIRAALIKQAEEMCAKQPAESDPIRKERQRQLCYEMTFAAWAKEHSTCPSKTDGGDLGMFRRIGVMVEPFAKVAFAQKPYDVSEPVETDFGYHLILVTQQTRGSSEV